MVVGRRSGIDGRGEVNGGNFSGWEEEWDRRRRGRGRGNLISPT